MKFLLTSLTGIAMSLGLMCAGAAPAATAQGLQQLASSADCCDWCPCPDWLCRLLCPECCQPSSCCTQTGCCAR